VFFGKQLALLCPDHTATCKYIDRAYIRKKAAIIDPYCTN
jgi:hypothetical protein